MDLLVRAYYTFLGEFYHKVSTMDTSKTAAPSSIADITFVEVQLGKYIVKAWLVALLLEKAEKEGYDLGGETLEHPSKFCIYRIRSVIDWALT